MSRRVVEPDALGGASPALPVAHNLKRSAEDEQVEARVTDKSRAIAATVAGAVIGGMAGYFFFTERGRELRRQFEPALDDFARELNSFRHTIRKAAGVAGEGWRVLNEAMEPEPPGGRHPGTHQTAPF
jgi:hypothetical protein